jgi:hypothetical protein
VVISVIALHTRENDGMAKISSACIIYKERLSHSSLNTKRNAVAHTIKNFLLELAKNESGAAYIKSG